MPKKPIYITALVSAVITMLLCLGVWFFTLTDADKLEMLILHHYAGEVDRETLSAGAARGMIGALDDRHSVYFDEDEYELFMEDLAASYTGIGVEVQLSDGRMQVIAPFEGTPAAEAGVLAGDFIEKVDDIVVTEQTFASAVTYMRTKDDDAPIMLSIIRDGMPLTITVVRREITLKTVTSEMIDDVAYIRIRSFDAPTAGEMATAIEEAERRNARGLVIDVRDNPGGYLESVTSISDMLLPRCTVVYTKDKNDRQLFYFESDADCTPLPIVLLINENSASASEVLAGALKDNKRAQLVGTKTFGKGSVQNVFHLGDGGAKITVAHFYTASGARINGNGVEPTHPVENTDPKVDAQLEMALSLLREE